MKKYLSIALTVALTIVGCSKSDSNDDVTRIEEQFLGTWKGVVTVISDPSPDPMEDCQKAPIFVFSKVDGQYLFAITGNECPTTGTETPFGNFFTVKNDKIIVENEEVATFAFETKEKLTITTKWLFAPREVTIALTKQ